MNLFRAMGFFSPFMTNQVIKNQTRSWSIWECQKVNNADNSSQSGSFHHIDKDYYGSQSGEEGSSGTFANKPSSSHPITAPSPLSGLPEFSHLGWGHWFTLRDLQVATNRFSKDNVIGEGDGVVYQGHLINGTPVAVKKLLNNLGQAEKEFRVEVEAIGHVRHKNLVRLLGYCIEGTHSGFMELCGSTGFLTWEARMKVLLGTAKALAYLHEAIEPKVVHRDIKSTAWCWGKSHNNTSHGYLW
ncbi:UNVERIFIED_CONTAM: putative receptor-like protein kinase, partial [Sesamum angustifolium]